MNRRPVRKGRPWANRPPRIPVCILMAAVIIVTAGHPRDASAFTNRTDEDVPSLGLQWEVADGHNATLWCVRWSPDGALIAATYFDNTTVVFDSGDGTVMAELGPHALPGAGWSGGGAGGGTRCDGGQDCTVDHPDHWPSRSNMFSPDGAYLATGGDNMKAIIYKTADWSVHRVLGEHTGSILSVCWSPDGKYLLTGTGMDKVDRHNEPENTLRVWDVENSTVEAAVRGFGDGVMNMRFSPNGSWVAAASDDKGVRVINTSDWKPLYTLAGHVNGVLDVCWSPDGERLASGSRDYKVRTWVAHNGTQGPRWDDANCVRSVDWHPGGSLIASSGVEEALCKIRNATTGDVILTLDEAGGTHSAVMSTRWSPDGNRLASGAGKEHTLRVYSFGVGQSLDDGGAEGIPRWAGGATVILVLAVAGTFLLYWPLIKKFREAGR